MPELNTQFPLWMLQKRAQDQEAAFKVGDQALRAIEIGSNNAYRNKQVMLQASNAALEHKQLEAQTEAAVLRNMETAMEIEDARQLQVATQAYANGNFDVTPNLRTYKGVGAWQKFKTTVDTGRAEAMEFNSFMESFNKLDGVGRANVRDIGWPIEQTGITRRHYETMSAEQARTRDELLKSKYGTETISVDGQKYLRTATGALHAVPPSYEDGAPAIPIVDDDGNVLAHGLRNSRGGLSLLRPPGGRRHPLQNKLDGLKAEAEGAKVSASAIERKKLPSLQAEIATLEKLITEDQAAATRQPSISTNAPAATGTNSPLRRLRYDSNTGLVR